MVGGRELFDANKCERYMLGTLSTKYLKGVLTICLLNLYKL